MTLVTAISTLTANPILQATMPEAASKTGKWLFSAMTAFAVTIFLVTVMQILITSPDLDVPDVPVYKIPNPVLVEKTIEPQKPLPPKKPEALEPEPIRPPLIASAIEVEGGVATTAYQPPETGFGDIQTTHSGSFPIVRMMIAPNYPHRAATKGIEGYVDLQFDITKTGATTNIQVTAAVPERIFNKAAINAIKKWKYTPQMRAGNPVPFYGMAKRLKFNLED